MTSIDSGLTPKEHGWLGWSCYFKEYNRYIEFFRNNDYYTKENVGVNVKETMMKYKHVAELIGEKVESYSIYPGFMERDFDTSEQAFQKVANLCNKPNKKFIFMYWDNPDYAIHEKGCKNV